jgi:hypothetical protein
MTCGQMLSALAKHDGVCLKAPLIRRRRNVQAAKDNLRSCKPVATGQPIGVLNLRREARNCDGIEFAGQAIQSSEIRDLEIGQVDAARSQSRQRQQPKARQRGDNLAALDHPRQRQPEAHQFGVLDTHAAHRNEAELHLAGAAFSAGRQARQQCHP